MEPVKPAELITAARMADGLVYVAGVSGVVAGALLFRDGDLPFAIIAWVLTFIAGAVLRLASWASRGIAQVMERSERIERDVRRLDRLLESPGRDPDDGPYSPGGLSGWH